MDMNKSADHFSIDGLSVYVEVQDGMVKRLDITGENVTSTFIRSLKLAELAQIAEHGATTMQRMAARYNELTAAGVTARLDTLASEFGSTIANVSQIIKRARSAGLVPPSTRKPRDR